MNLKIICQQANFMVGAIEKNSIKIIELANAAKTQQADMIVFPELAITGYPPEDLLYRPALYDRVNTALQQIQQQVHDIAVIVGYPVLDSGKRFNRAAVVYNGALIAHYDKRELPNYTVFDEKRYFSSGNRPCVFEFKDHKIGLLICEDIWIDLPVRETVAAGADILISINASPFAKDKDNARHHLVKQHVQRIKKPFIYCALVGGQDEIVFDGGSFVYNAEANLHLQAPYFCEHSLAIHFNNEHRITDAILKPKKPGYEKKIYAALVLGVKDYIEKNGFKGILVGLSGGVDSALTLTIAVDAIGKENVHAVMMPSRFTSAMSLTDAKAQADNLGVHYSVIDIETCFSAFLQSLAPEFKNLPLDATEENIQARCRGVLLMALSNKTGKLVLTTGNKSEMAVGYATLYGDMAGGFAVLKDVYKTDVYKLCRYRNHIAAVIPTTVLTRAPSAELAANQTDQDTLPDYAILDEIIERYVGQDESAEKIAEHGFDLTIVNEIVRRINHNEYKRRQAPIGIRITERAFGKDRRYPITSGF